MGIIIGIMLINLIINNLIPGKTNKNKEISLIFSIITLYVVLGEILKYNINNNEYQERIEICGYPFGLDGIGIGLIGLMTIIDPILIMLVKGEREEGIERKRIINNLIIIKILIVILFASLDLFVFFITFELILVPMFILITRYGSKYQYFLPRLEAGIRFFMFTMMGSILMFLAIILFYIKYGTTSNELLNYKINETLSINSDNNLLFFQFLWIFLFFSFLIKIPMFPFHTWLPLAHSDAPTIGSIILAALLLKLASFGILRYSLYLFQPLINTYPVKTPLFPPHSVWGGEREKEGMGFIGKEEGNWERGLGGEKGDLEIGKNLGLEEVVGNGIIFTENIESIYNIFLPIIYILALISIIYSSFIPLRGLYDFKKIIAYSSIIHMNFSIFGFFSKDLVGLTGASLLMFTHAFISSALFLLIGLLYKRYHSRFLPYFQGLSISMPLFTFFFIFFSLANISLPFCSSFLSEFFILVSSFHFNPFISFLLAFSLIISSAFVIWFANRLLFGNISSYLLPSSSNPSLIPPIQLQSTMEKTRGGDIEYGGSKDLSLTEFLTLTPFFLFTFFLTFFPQPLISILSLPLLLYI